LVPNVGQEDVLVDAADDESSDDDIVDETVKEMHEILVKVPPLSPVRAAGEASTKRNLRPVPSITRRVNSTEANTDEQLLSELRKGNGQEAEHDSSDLHASSLCEALSKAGHRTRSRSRSRGKEAQPLSLAKRVIDSKITGAGLVVKRRPVLETKTASSTRNFKVSKSALLVNKNLLKGQQLLRHCPGLGDCYGTVNRFNLERNTYTEVERRLH
jgi:hypothetical protein